MANAEEQTENNNNTREKSNKRRPAMAKPRTESPKLGEVVSDARQSLEGLMDNWREMVDQHPWKALGIALGAGYVVGGGLLTTLTGRFVLGAARMGVRLAALPVVRDELMSLVQSATERGRGEQERRNQ
jgi:ElaB/YqjD/DUF883 family membrane-anchored ribosome-binding protein